MTRVHLIVGDIGGTNTRLGIVRSIGGLPQETRRFRNAEHQSFGSLLSDYLASVGVNSAAMICLAVAGVASGNRIELTNHAWTIDRDELCKITAASEALFINDLKALGLSLAHERSMPPTLLAGTPPRSAFAPRLVVGVGTGFNAALVTQHNALAKPSVSAAECGHMTLVVETETELRLRHFLARGRGRASIERALSGAGLVEIYQWVAAETGQTPAALNAAEIAGRAIDQSDPVCSDAAEIALKLLARTAGDLALAFLPMGGVYLAGSVARGLAPLMPLGGFHDTFIAKGRQTELLRSIPVFLMEDDGAALLGCVVHAQKNSQSFDKIA